MTRFFLFEKPSRIISVVRLLFHSFRGLLVEKCSMLRKMENNKEQLFCWKEVNRYFTTTWSVLFQDKGIQQLLKKMCGRCGVGKKGWLISCNKCLSIPT